jgi:hypothetical protein
MGRRPGVAPLPAVVVLVVTAAAVALVAYAAGSSSSAGAAGSWERAPAAPLSAREDALGVWTGREAIVFGGSGPPYYSPGWEGPTVERPPLRDGAAFDPRTRTWRPISPAPVGVHLGTAVFAGGSVYVSVAMPPGGFASRRVLVAYRVEDDRWERLPSPPARGHVQLVAAGERLVAFRARPRPGPPGYLLRKGERAWRPLPDDPFPRRWPRGLFWNGRRLVLITTVPLGPDAQGRPLARAATLRLHARRWRKLPDSGDVLYGHLRWVRVGSRLVSSELEDGSGEFRWGRPVGGILDPERGVWSDLPELPATFGFEFGTGVLTRTLGTYQFPHGWVLDMARHEWLLIPRLPTGWGFEWGGATAVGMNRDLLAFGGPRYGRRGRGRLVNEAWIWSPPAAAAQRTE